ncbi:MAG: PQQ-binding-like beta-propeller repeat protein [Gemmataceae bacterium]|nr:PQQ-binding-like beta-propeller repeat protein [Gemmataceae bacterium]
MRALVVALCLVGVGCAGSQAQDNKSAKDAPAGDLRTRKTGSDWPCFLGPAGNSTSSEKGILTPWPEKGPRLVWQQKLGQGYSAPVISQGRLFLFDRHGNNATLHSWKSETAEPIWKFEYPTFYRDHFGYNGGPRCCPVVDGDRVYIHGVEGMLHCLRVSDGKLLWKVDTKEQFGFIQNFFGVGSTPVVEDDLLIVQVGGSPKGSERVEFADLKGNGSGVVAFDKLTGKVRYQISDELASYASPVLATINNRRWCFVLARGGLIACEPKTGKVDFHFPWRAEAFESANASNPIVVGDRVFLSECYGPGGVLLQVRPGGYKVLCSDKGKRRGKSMQCHWMTPIHHEGYVYGSSGRHLEHADLRCVELATGKEMWSQPNLTRCSLLMVDGHFVCLAEEGLLYLLKVNPKRLEVVSRVELRDPETNRPLLEFPCWAAPVLAHGLLYVRGENRLVCLELIPPKKE